MNHKTAAEALAAFDRGEVITSVEMGGIGPGYEQTIQLLTFELIRDHIGKRLPLHAGSKWGEATVKKHDRSLLGLSGAQVGAAKWLAFNALRDGWEEVVNRHPLERRICISNCWPRIEVRA